MSLPETVEELIVLFGQLRDEVMDIDAQLASRAVRPDGTRPTTPHYREWRSQAVHSKQSKTRQMARVKQRLEALTKESSTQFWRNQTVGFVKAMEDIVLDPDWAAERALNALSEYERQLGLRKEVRGDRGNG